MKHTLLKLTTTNPMSNGVLVGLYSTFGGDRGNQCHFHINGLHEKRIRRCNDRPHDLCTFAVVVSGSFPTFTSRF